MTTKFKFNGKDSREVERFYEAFHSYIIKRGDKGLDELEYNKRRNNVREKMVNRCFSYLNSKYKGVIDE